MSQELESVVEVQNLAEGNLSGHTYESQGEHHDAHHPHSLEEVEGHETEELRGISPSEGGLPVVEGGGSEDFSLFRWHLNGRKRLKKTGGNEETYRKYYRCANYNRPNKEEGCKAGYWQDWTGEVGGALHTTHMEHNHPPPLKPRISKETWTKCKNLVANGVKPSLIQKMISGKESDQPGTSSSPTRKQIENMAARLKRSVLPSGHATRNMIGVFGQPPAHFLQLMEVHPQLNIICLSEEARELLSETQSLIIDTNAEICEGKLYLNTFIARVGDRFLPFGFFITNAKSEQNYIRIFNSVQDIVKLPPTLLVVPFDSFTRSVVQSSFPEGTNVVGSLFSFIAENIKKFEQLQMGVTKEAKTSLEAALKELAESEDVKTFTEVYQVFESNWAPVYQDYFLYFHETWMKPHPPETWMKNFPPETWANFHRAGVYNEMLDSWQQKIQKWANFKDVDMVDKLVKFLHEEWTSYRAQFPSPIHSQPILN